MCQGSKENKIGNYQVYKNNDNCHGNIIIDITNNKSASKKISAFEFIKELEIISKLLLLLMFLSGGYLMGIPLSILFIFSIIPIFILFGVWVFLRNN